MTTYLAKFLRNNYTCLTRLYISFIAIIIFITGIGRFRSVLFLSVFFMVYAIALIYNRRVETVKNKYAPILVMLIYYDIKLGPVWPVFSFNNIGFALAAFLVMNPLFESYFKKVIEKITNGDVFTLCQKCQFESKQFTVKCGNCGFTRIEEVASGRTNSNLLQSVPSNKQDALLWDNEKVRFKIDLVIFSGASLYKNGSRVKINRLVITDKRIILTYKLFYYRGFSRILDISLSDITDVHIEKRNHHGLDMDAVIFADHENNYELFQLHNKEREELMPIMKYIEGG